MNQFIYNVTTKVAHSVHKTWLRWMQEVHIPNMIATGCFSKAVILKLRDVDESEGPTYAVQYYAADEPHYERYLNDFSTELRKETLDKWGNQIVAFRTVMEVVN